MTSFSRRGASMMIAAVATACSPAATFNRLTPKDKEGRLLAKGESYGPHLRHKFDVYGPRAPSAQPLPWIAFFYGGSWQRGERGLYHWFGRSLAAQGYGVAVIDYRLVPEVRFPDFLDDCAAGVARVRARAAEFGFDPERLALMGHSAGAYNAIFLALEGARLQKAGAPAGALRAAIGLAGPYDFLPFEPGAAQAAFAHWPDPAATQPITFARADAPPLLLLHGAEDDVVGLKNQRNLAARLRALGAVVDVKEYPGIDHIEIISALSIPFRKKAPVRADIAAFLSAHV